MIHKKIKIYVVINAAFIQFVKKCILIVLHEKILFFFVVKWSKQIM
jgi:hypothetical protein